MTVDELITELEEIKKISPLAGRLVIIKRGRKEKELYRCYKNKSTNGNSNLKYHNDCIVFEFD